MLWSQTETNSNEEKREETQLQYLLVDGAAYCGIPADLLILRERYCRFLARHAVVKGPMVNSDDLENDWYRHTKDGLMFWFFKAAFREGKFGILHTRCTSRCDHEAYIQMICLVVFTLLKSTSIGTTLPIITTIVPHEYFYAARRREGFHWDRSLTWRCGTRQLIWGANVIYREQLMRRWDVFLSKLASMMVKNDNRGEGSVGGIQSSISFVFADKKGVILSRRKYHTFFVGLV